MKTLGNANCQGDEHGSWASTTTAPLLKMGHEKKASAEQPLTADHRPIPLPEDLTEDWVVSTISQRQICMAIAENHIKLSPACQKKLTLSTYHGFLLQTPIHLMASP